MTRPQACAPEIDAALSLEVCEKAMQWWLDLQDSDADERTLAALAQWRSAHRTHEIAWQRAQALASRMNAFRQTGDVTLAKRALLTPAGKALGRRRVIKGMAILLVAGGSAWSARHTTLAQQLYADYSTGVGERQHVLLSSQLALTLNTRSAVNARLVDHRWQIDLLDGEVLIDTAVTPPLLLRTDQVHASTASARFSVRRMNDGATLLAVLKGTLQVTPLQTTGTLLLAAGEQAQFGPRATLERSPLQPSSTAWSQGMIVAHGQPLRAFLAEVARYRHGHLGCDETLANLPVWGTYPLADSEQIIDAVAGTLKLDVQRFTRLWVNLRQPARNA